MSHVQTNHLRDTQLKTLWIARIDYSKESGVNSHTHDFYQILVVMEGKGEIQINGKSNPILEGHFYFFPKGIKHQFRFFTKAVTIDVKFSVHDENLKNLISMLPPMGQCDLNDIAEVKQWFTLSLNNAKDPHPLIPFRIDSGFKGTLLSIMHKSHRAQVKVKEQACTENNSNFPMAEFIHKNIMEKITLVDIANHFGFHPHYLIKIFNDNMGVSPIQYLQEKRLEKAKEYLEFTNLSVKEISEKLNWTNSYFSRLFHQREGISPSEFRRNVTTAVGKDIVLAQDFQNEWQIVSY
jgi:AraC-like DNA-binding protein